MNAVTCCGSCTPILRLVRLRKLYQPHFKQHLAPTVQKHTQGIVECVQCVRRGSNRQCSRGLLDSDLLHLEDILGKVADLGHLGSRQAPKIDRFQFQPHELQAILAGIARDNNSMSVQRNHKGRVTMPTACTACSNPTSSTSSFTDEPDTL